jgi:hypothetical protein
MILWSDLQTEHLPYKWPKSVNRILKNETLPDLKGQLFYVTSDYSGQHKGSQYEALSFFYVDLDNLNEWNRTRHVLRKRHLPDGRRISFKGLNDNNKRAFLIPFLQASSKLNGFLLTVVVNKKIESLCLQPKELDMFTKLFELRSKWNFDSLEYILRILNFVCILSAGLARPNQEIYWITDEDSFTQDKTKLQDVQKLIGHFSGAYGNHLSECKLGLGSATIDPGDRMEEDLLALSDLSAGAMSEIVNANSRQSGGSISTSVLLRQQAAFSDKTEIIFDWYNTVFTNLTKCSILFETGPGGKGFSVSKYNTL